MSCSRSLLCSIASRPYAARSRIPPPRRRPVPAWCATCSASGSAWPPWKCSPGWPARRDIADAAEELAVLATAASATGPGQLDDVEDELFRFGRIASGEPELIAALSSPRYPDEQKRGLLNTLLADKVALPTLRLITQAVVNPRGRNLEANLADYARLVAEWRQRLIAVVRVATALSDRQRERLTAALSAIYDRGIQLNVVIDPQVVGGVSIQIGDDLIDGTLSSRLAALRRHWAA